MKKDTGVKARHEYKYFCNALQSGVLKLRAQGIMKRDSHAGIDGSYRIRSLYFDDLEDRCFYENESGIGERDKYRIRIYNGDPGRITLEKKSKRRGMTIKVAEGISETMCRQMMSGRVMPVRGDMTDTLRILLSEMNQRSMQPKVIVEYVRYPFVERNGNVRVTFDESIGSSNALSRFLDGDIPFRPIIEGGG